MMQRHLGLYQSTLLQRVPSLLHGFSGRAMGNMKKDLAARKRFFDAVGIDGDVTISEQIHGAVVSFVDGAKESPIVGSDGLVVNKAGRALGVFTADCVPILCVDPTSRTIAVAHAGWRGTYGKIAQHAVESMKSGGAQVANILIWVGPHIGMCCYWVDQDRAKRFVDGFGKDPQMASFFENSWHLDLGYVNYRQLIESGIKSENIDVAITCTSCQHDEFFSYRKDSKETFGEMMGVIEWI
jgi:YfiH family protein